MNEFVASFCVMGVAFNFFVKTFMPVLYFLPWKTTESMGYEITFLSAQEGVDEVFLKIYNVGLV